MDDAALVKAFLAGDSTAFAELYERYKTPALRTAFLIVGNSSDSENVLQDTFVKVWQSLGSLKNAEHFKPWFMRILVRTAWEYCRKQGREQPVADVWEQKAPPVDEGSLLEQVLQTERHNELWAAINSLDVKQRTVIVLYYYSEMSVAEIAAATGAYSGTVKSRLFAARRQLRRLLTADTLKCREVQQ